MNARGTSTEDEALLVAYVDGELGLVESMAFEQRLASEPQLEAALREFLAAEDLGQQLAHRRPLRSSPHLARRTRHLTILGVALVAAAALLLSMPLLIPRPTVSFDLTEVARAPTRGGDPSGLEFRVRVRCPEERYILILTIARKGSQLSVVQRHPVPAGPLMSRDADWPTDPFTAGSEVLLPPASKYPMQTAEDSLVLVCSRPDTGFSAPEIELLKRDVEAACAARLAAGDGQHGLRSHCEEVAAAVRTAGRAGWSIACNSLTAP